MEEGRMGGKKGGKQKIYSPIKKLKKIKCSFLNGTFYIRFVLLQIVFVVEKFRKFHYGYSQRQKKKAFFHFITTNCPIFVILANCEDYLSGTYKLKFCNYYTLSNGVNFLQS